MYKENLGVEKKNVVIYARANSADALACQVQYFETFAASKGWYVSGVYTDVCRANAKKRRGFNALLDDIQHGAFDVLLIDHILQLSRNINLTRKINTYLKSRSIDLIQASGGIDINNDMLLCALYLVDDLLREARGRSIAFGKNHLK